MMPGTFCICLFGCSDHPLLQLDFIIKADTVVFHVPCVLEIVSGHLWMQHPIGTMCQLGLSQPANIVGTTFVLSALQCFWTLLHGHIADCFHHGFHQPVWIEHIF